MQLVIVAALLHLLPLVLSLSARPRARSAFIPHVRSTHLDWDAARPDTAFTSPRLDGHSVHEFTTGSTRQQQQQQHPADSATLADHAGTASSGNPKWENLGGSVASYPSACSWGTGRLDIFHMTRERSCQHRSYGGYSSSSSFTGSYSWSSWQTLGGSLDGGVAVSSHTEGSFTIAVKGTDNQCWQRAYTGGGGGGAWGDWQTLGGNISHDVGLVSRGGVVSVSQSTSASLDLFVSAPDGQCWTKTWSYSSSWSTWTALGGYLDSAPRAVSWGRDHMSLYCRSTDGQAWWRRWNGWTWESWTSLGGSVIGTPSAFAYAGYEYVVVRGTDGACWYRSWHAGTWSQWASLGGSLRHEPEVVSYLQWGGGVDVYINHDDGGLYRKSWDNRTDAWSQEWEPMGGKVDSKPGAIAWDNGTRTDAFGQGKDGSCQRLVMSEGRNDTGFTNES
ncbi:hypothetical protein B0T26DRAFT_673561 [Lasiosphaeria miniovina]|uniref:PLL-like beta propeller domain-containing protein n=1 Tax=Lasiosphaeria miniovina TaxID=1954250 RepID=A0AA40E2H3_9PEZI|nr:uncharacterized protein B0T26DRAFT_673561 [Lasiosphaeria miniovina]KAK0721776.1 hypothetical protein B0T26DRAFT_673561 [Lasiosphaeria miniovina]